MDTLLGCLGHQLRLIVLDSFPTAMPSASSRLRRVNEPHVASGLCSALGVFQPIPARAECPRFFRGDAAQADLSYLEPITNTGAVDRGVPSKSMEVTGVRPSIDTTTMDDGRTRRRNMLLVDAYVALLVEGIVS